MAVVDPKSLTIDAKKLMRLSVSDRNQMIRHTGFREAILSALTPFQIASLFPDYYKQGGGGGGGGGAVGGGGGGILSSLLSGMTPTDSGGFAGGTAAPATAARPAGPQPGDLKAPVQTYGWYNRFMSLKPESKVDAKAQGFKPLETPTGPTGPGQISINKNGYVNKQQFYKAAVEKFRNSSLNGFKPQDGKKYGIDGTPESWARFAMRTAHVESGFNVNTTNMSDPGGSLGLFQWGYQYGITKDNWRDPNSQLDAFVTYANKWVVGGGGYILPPQGVQAKRYGGYGGFGAAFSTVRNDKVNGRDAISVADSLAASESTMQEATKVLPQDVSKSQAIMPEPGLGPTGSAGRAGAQMGYGPEGPTPQQRPLAMDPGALNDLNLKRPGHIKGNITFEGDTESAFQFGSGGARGSRGSVPYGTYEIMPGLHQKSKYKSFENNSFYVRDMFDPQVGDTRKGILLHQASDWQNMYTHGCLGIRPNQWPAFKAKMLEYQKNSGGGPVYLTVGPDGNAKISSTKPTNMQFQTASQATKDRPDLPPGADPGLAASNLSKLPAGLPEGLIKEFSTYNPADQEKLINQLNAMGPEGVTQLTNAYNQDVATRPQEKAQNLIQTVQDTPPGQMPIQQADETIAKAAAGQIAPTSKAVDTALSLKGLNERTDRATLKSFLDNSRRTSVDPANVPWCSSFVNAAMESAGVKGTGSAMAASWFKWGESVKDPKSVQKGDVVVTSRHVAIATGPAYQDKSGRWIIPTVGGNQGMSGKRGIEWVSETPRAFEGVSVRRAGEKDYYQPLAEATAVPEAPAPADSQAIQPGGASSLGPTDTAGSTGAQIGYGPSGAEQQQLAPTATPLPTPDNPFLGINFPEGMPRPNMDNLSPDYKAWASAQDRASLQQRIDQGWQNTSDFKKAFANPERVSDAMVKKFNETRNSMDPDQLAQQTKAVQETVQHNVDYNKQLQSAAPQQSAPAPAPAPEPAPMPEPSVDTGSILPGFAQGGTVPGEDLTVINKQGKPVATASSGEKLEVTPRQRQNSTELARQKVETTQQQNEAVGSGGVKNTGAMQSGQNTLAETNRNAVGLRGLDHTNYRNINESDSSKRAYNRAAFTDPDRPSPKIGSTWNKKA